MPSIRMYQPNPRLDDGEILWLKAVVDDDPDSPDDDRLSIWSTDSAGRIQHLLVHLTKSGFVFYPKPVGWPFGSHPHLIEQLRVHNGISWSREANLITDTDVDQAFEKMKEIKICL